jgi:hypothetical protein
MLRRHELLLEMLANATLRIARASIDAAEPNEEMTREFEAMLDALQKEREADRSAEWEATLRNLKATWSN